jgi:hypothetical protein
VNAAEAIKMAAAQSFVSAAEAIADRAERFAAEAGQMSGPEALRIFAQSVRATAASFAKDNSSDRR